MGSGSSAQNTVKGTNQAMSPSKGVRFHPEVGSDSRGTVMYPAQRSTALKSFSYDDIDHMIAENRQRRIVVIKRKVYDLTSCMESLKASPFHELLTQKNGKDITDEYTAHPEIQLQAEWLIGRLMQQDDELGSTLLESSFTTSIRRERAGLTMANIQSMIAADKKRIILVMFGDAYELTAYISDHPGGASVLKKHSGKECGDTFMRIHGMRAREMARRFFMGHVVDAPKTAESPIICKQTTTKAIDDLVFLHPTAKSTRVLEVQASSTSPNIRYLTLTTSSPLPLRPGGHIKLFSNLDENCSRPYTPYISQIASFSICVKLYPKGVTSGYLFSLAEESELFFEGPFPPSWRATEDPKLQISIPASDKRVMLLGGGTGIAPMYSIAEDLLRSNVANVTLVCSVHTLNDVLLENELKELLDVHKNLKAPECRLQLFFVLSQPATAGASIPWADATFTGSRISATVLKDIHAKTGNPTVQAVVMCGPPGFNTDVPKAVAAAGICASDCIHVL